MAVLFVWRSGTAEFELQYRTFHNSDPPQILRLWHASNLGPSAAEGFPCDILELFVFSQPFFDRNGFFVAVEDDRITGFVHAGFAATADGTALDRTRGIICAIVVHPDFRRRGVGAKLMQLAEEYLTQRGTTSICAGGGLEGNGFYNGIYGGLQASGFSTRAAPFEEFMAKLGYRADQTTQILHRDLTIGRDPVSARLIRHRRRLNLVITDRVGDLSWWWHVRFGHMDALKFELQEREDQSLVASGQIVGLDVYVPKWGVRGVGIRDVIVPEGLRHHGYGLSLVLEICRRLREQSIQLIEAQIDVRNEPALGLFSSAGFEDVGILVSYRRDL
ncbi:MAG: GNAT family N-acetyltransferase [Fuerstiella sp.]